MARHYKKFNIVRIGPFCRLKKGRKTGNRQKRTIEVDSDKISIPWQNCLGGGVMLIVELDNKLGAASTGPKSNLYY